MQQRIGAIKWLTFLSDGSTSPLFAYATRLEHRVERWSDIVTLLHVSRNSKVAVAVSKRELH